ncbi:serine protease HTRA1-like [Oppia nitens]|uniref:serine protease HTRA1-like n=1 Tax=Oppia nitens TaxID=1686743 RepID=UPI0023D9F29C|nr:serine protease HTRA1-like [Oppia nitens]
MSSQMFNWCLTGLLIKSYHLVQYHRHICRHQLMPTTKTTTITTTSLTLLSLVNCFSKLFDVITNNSHYRFRCAHQLSTIDQIVDKSMSKTVQLLVDQSIGTGCVVSSYDGFVVTCAHVVEDQRDAIVLYDLTGYGQGWRWARVVYLEPHHDLALLEISYDSTIGDQLWNKLNNFDICRETVNFGDNIVCLGYPMDDRLSIATGYIACPQRVQPNHMGYIYVPMDCSDQIENRIGLTYGFSGGPVINENGQLVGIHHSTFNLFRHLSTSSTIVPELMINANNFSRKQRKLIHNGKRDVSRRRRRHTFDGQPFGRQLGLEICWYNSANIKYYKKHCRLDGRRLRSRNVYLNGNGIFVYQFFNDTQGNIYLHDFDVIIKINGKPVESIDDLSRALVMIASSSDGDSDGDTIRLTIIRNGRDIEISISGEQLMNGFSFI